MPAARRRSGTSRRTARVGDEPIAHVHPGEAVPGARQAHRRRGALLDGGRRPRLLRGRARPARLRGEVLHRGRQLGPRRQQPRRLLHPRRDQVPGLHPLPEAGPGHVRAPGPQPRLRLHLPDARVDAHGHARLRPARHPRELPDDAGLRRQHLQVGQRRRARRCSSSTTGSRSRASAAGPRTTPPRQQAEELGCHTQGPLRRDRPRRVPGVGAARPDDGRPRAPRARLRPARRHEGLAGGRVPAEAGRPDGARPQRRRTSSPRTSRSRSAPACWSTGSTSPTTRCSSGGRSPTATRSATASGRTTCSSRSTSRRTAGRAPTSATAQMAYYVDDDRREPARQLRAVDHGRAARGAHAGARRAGPGDPRAPHPRADPAHATTTSRPASATCSSEQWERDDLVANLDAPARPVRPPDPGADGLAPVHGRGRARAARRRRPRHLGRRRPRPPAAGDARRSPRTSSQRAREPRREPRRATSRAS